MAITSYIPSRVGNVTTVTVVSDLTAPVWFYWYVDGSFAGSSTSNSRAFILAPEDQVEIIAVDSNDPDEDPLDIAPEGFPARRTLAWTRSIDPDVVEYLVEQQINGGAYAQIGLVNAVAGQWLYEFTTPRLIDLATYNWKVTPYDIAGDAGSNLTLIATEKVVRTPDAPQYTATFNDTPDTVTFDAA